MKNATPEQIRQMREYASNIKNTGKKDYANAYIDFSFGWSATRPVFKDFGIGFMAAQSVMLRLTEISK